MAPATTPVADSRTAILDAAEELFATQGFSATSIKQIGEQSASNPALIYYYFDDKQGLYREVLGRIGQTLASTANAQRPTVGATVEDHIAAIVAAQTELLVRRPRAVLIIARELLDHQAAQAQPLVQRLASEIFRPLVATLEAGKTRGELPADLDPGHAVISTIAQMVYFAFAKPLIRILLDQGPSFPGPDDIRAFGVHATRFALGGLGLARPRGAS